MKEFVVCPKGFDCALLNSCPSFHQKCPEGYFCGSYEGDKYQSDIDFAYAVMATRFRAEVVITNHNKDEYIAANRTVQTQCVQGFYCPSDQLIQPCTSDHWCSERTVEPFACDVLSICSSEEGAFQVNFVNALIMFILLTLCLGSSSLVIRRQRKKVLVTRGLDPSARIYDANKGEHNAVSTSSSVVEVEFSGVQYEVGKGTVVLPGISGEVPGGQITALLGPTACGKSSLLNCIRSGGTNMKEGEILITTKDTITGHKKKLPIQSLSSYIGYVPQEDVFDRDLTVRELLLLNAMARSRRWVSFTEACQIVDQVLAELAIQHISETIIGGGENTAANISGGQLKRVNIACELVAVSRPALLLLDEPTAGLDATIAYELMETLESIRDKGITIFMVIQQPRSEIFSRIEHLFLMNQLGGIVYEGKSCNVITYLDTVGYKIGSETSDADFCLDVLNGIVECDKEEENRGPNTLHQHWSSIKDEYLSGLRAAEEGDNLVDNKTQAISSGEVNEISMAESDEIQRLTRQFFLQAYRLLIVRIRNFNALVMYAFISVIMACALSSGFSIYIATSYLSILTPSLQSSLQLFFPSPLSKYSTGNVTGVGFEQLMFFMSSALGSAACLAAVPVFAGKVSVVSRERSAGMSVWAYILGSLVADLVFVILNAFVFTGIWCLFGHAGEYYDWMATILGTAFASSAIGYIASVSVRKNSASVFAIISTFICCVFAGVEPTVQQVDRYPVVNWPWYLSYATWTAEACYVTWSKYLTNNGNVDVDVQQGADKYGYVVDEGLARSVGALFAIGIGLRLIAGAILFYRTKGQ